MFPCPTVSLLSSTLHYSPLPPPAKPILPNITDHFDVYKILTIPLPNLSTVGRYHQVNRIQGTPAVPPGPGRKEESPSHFDTVLVRCETEIDNRYTKGTSLEGMYLQITHTLCAHAILRPLSCASQSYVHPTRASPSPASCSSTSVY